MEISLDKHLLTHIYLFIILLIPIVDCKYNNIHKVIIRKQFKGYL